MIALKKCGLPSRRYWILQDGVVIGEAWPRRSPSGSTIGFVVSLEGIYWRSGGRPTRRGGTTAQRVKLLRDVVPFVTATLETIAKEAPRLLTPAEITEARLTKVLLTLRDSHGVQQGTDYSFTVENNEVRILCNATHANLIEEVFGRVEQPIAGLHTYRTSPLVAHDEKETS